MGCDPGRHDVAQDTTPVNKCDVVVVVAGTLARKKKKEKKLAVHARLTIALTSWSARPLQKRQLDSIDCRTRGNAETKQNPKPVVVVVVVRARIVTHFSSCQWLVVTILTSNSS